MNIDDSLIRKKIRIQIIEDNRMSAELLYEIIGGAYDRVICRTGEDAIFRYKTNKPDIVFLDIELPDMSGHDVLNKIREINPDQYVVIVTGNGTKKNVEEALNKKVHGFLCKPYSRDKIMLHVDVVKKATEKGRQKAQSEVNEKVLSKIKE